MLSRKKISLFVKNDSKFMFEYYYYYYYYYYYKL